MFPFHLHVVNPVSGAEFHFMYHVTAVIVEVFEQLAAHRILRVAGHHKAWICPEVIQGRSGEYRLSPVPCACMEIEPCVIVMAPFQGTVNEYHGAWAAGVGVFVDVVGVAPGLQFPDILNHLVAEIAAHAPVLLDDLHFLEQLIVVNELVHEPFKVHVRIGNKYPFFGVRGNCVYRKAFPEVGIVKGTVQHFFQFIWR